MRQKFLFALLSALWLGIGTVKGFDAEATIDGIASGKIILRGVCCGFGITSTPIEEIKSELKKLKSYGANHVRLYLYPGGLTEDERKIYGNYFSRGLYGRPAAVRVLASIWRKRWLPLFEELELPVILSVSCGGSFLTAQNRKNPDAGLLWNNEEVRREYIDFICETIRTFNDRIVIGFEVLNEPFPQGTVNKSFTTWKMSWDRSRDKGALPAFYNRLIKRVRAFDQRLLAIQSGPGGSPEGMEQLLQVDYDPRLLYCFHQYFPEEFTHAGINEYRASNDGKKVELYSYPEKLTAGQSSRERLDYYRKYHPASFPEISRKTMAEYLHPARIFQEKRQRQTGRHCAMWVGEFGSVCWTPGKSAVNWTRDSLELFTAYGWGWSYFIYTPYVGNDPHYPFGHKNREGNPEDFDRYVKARKENNRDFFATAASQERASFQVVKQYFKEN